jgi:hypothetical protein
MKAARESRKRTTAVHAQVDSFLGQLAKASELAEALDDAVMREDKNAVIELLKNGGLDGEITIEKIEADRMILIQLCVSGPGFSCIKIFIEW